MKNLVSMTDFVLLEENYGSFKTCFQYANFLKQPLKLWMFMPCDIDGKERCLFFGHDFDLETINHHIKLGRTVEYFTSFKNFLQLTPTALKQIEL